MDLGGAEEVVPDKRTEGGVEREASSLKGLLEDGPQTGDQAACRMKNVRFFKGLGRCRL